MTVHSPVNEWSELEAAQRSEHELEQIMRHGAPQVNAQQLEQAKRDALKAMVVGLPDPKEVARWLETADPSAAETLRQAWVSTKVPYAGVRRIANNGDAATLRSLGLVGWITKDDGLAVGAFGCKVRRWMIEESEEDDDA